ncbi:MAG: pyridoxal phosphate-dependent aminotransferase [Bacteroidales bacterium]|jgi:aspartate/methionine/tyrosine aminotransferase|nr:pyridoxal phosphate-dependent aminotransferase [Bacteroidales bacterium]
MQDPLFSPSIIEKALAVHGITNVGTASIREIKKLINDIEAESDMKFIRMEMGIPGLSAVQTGIDAEIEALRKGVGAIYPDVYGIPELKNEISRFVKNFTGIDVLPSSCVPTVGSMQGSFAAFLTLSRAQKGKDTTLFIDPGFAVHKQQHRLLQIPYESFDVYSYRGQALREKLESYLAKGNISSIFYSNPNNPSWICFTEDELQVIGELAAKYNVIVMEDLAYFGMDFRVDIGTPGVPPYQATVARYTDKYILFISSSKAFSYAGQRMGMMVISDKLFKTKFPDFERFYSSTEFGHTMVFETIYPLSSGTAHSPQYGLAAILKAANDGQYNFVQETRVYADKARELKRMFLANGFHIVYDHDIEQQVSDGFYFTVGYGSLSGDELLHNLLYFGVSAISLSITGSERQGIRICVSLVSTSSFPELERRLQMFHEWQG